MRTAESMKRRTSCDLFHLFLFFVFRLFEHIQSPTAGIPPLMKHSVLSGQGEYDRVPAARGRTAATEYGHGTKRKRDEWKAHDGGRS